ncbi:MAG: phosphotransferase [Planctomycetota bacterium]
MDQTSEDRWLSASEPDGIRRRLQALGWLPDTTITHIKRAGEGNMNLTVRLVTANGESVILKQSRPWVEKYPSIEAPEERIEFEHAFYRRVVGLPGVAERTPRVLAFDAAQRLMLMEDLGESSDFASLYGGGTLSEPTADALVDWLAALHEHTRGTPDATMANRSMRELNYAHIFDLPLRAAMLDEDTIEPGLAAAAAQLREDAGYVAKVRMLGERYLDDGPCLLHGDFFPGSWLDTGAGVRVIDPEFGFYGAPEFDLAISVAHLALTGQPWATAERWLSRYRAAVSCPVDEDLVAGFAAAEVMRRIIGVAQLPLSGEAVLRVGLLQASRRALAERQCSALWP